eukprot:6209316-Pleurochrysis_carterae.AAC.1
MCPDLRGSTKAAHAERAACRTKACDVVEKYRGEQRDVPSCRRRRDHQAERLAVGSARAVAVLLLNVGARRERVVVEHVCAERPKGQVDQRHGHGHHLHGVEGGGVAAERVQAQREPHRHRAQQ